MSDPGSRGISPRKDLHHGGLRHLDAGSVAIKFYNERCRLVDGNIFGDSSDALKHDQIRTTPALAPAQDGKCVESPNASAKGSNSNSWGKSVLLGC
jgi:hypothetical protein